MERVAERAFSGDLMISAENEKVVGEKTVKT